MSSLLWKTVSLAGFLAALSLTLGSYVANPPGLADQTNRQVPPDFPFGLPSSTETQRAAKDFQPRIPEVKRPNPKEWQARLEALLKELPPEHYDIKAAVKKLEPGLEAAFAFVRHTIRFEAYPGVLRGAQQTFLARAGNSLDRSFLLAEILKGQKVTTRFVRGRLSRADSEKLFARIFEAPSTGKPANPPGSTPSSLPARVRARALRDYSVIRATLGEDFPKRGGMPLERVLAEIQDHVWLQAQQEGKWIDLDSAFAGAKPGQAFARPDKTFPSCPRSFTRR